MPIRRAAYVAALRQERASVAAKPEPDERRLAAIDDQLAMYEPRPDRVVLEKAVPNPAAPSPASAGPAVPGPVDPGLGPVDPGLVEQGPVAVGPAAARVRGGRRGGQGA